MRIKSKSRLKEMIKPTFSSFCGYVEKPERSFTRKEHSGLGCSLARTTGDLKIVEKLYQGLEKDSEGCVSGQILIKKILGAVDLTWKNSLENKICAYFNQEDISEVKISPEDCFSIFFSSQKDLKIVQSLKEHLRPSKVSPSLPGIKVNNPLRSPAKLRIFRSCAFNHIEDSSTQQYFKLLSEWWDELSKGKDFVGIPEFSQYTVKKGIFESLSKAEGCCKKWFDIVTKVEFFEVFVIGITRSQIAEMDRKINLKMVSRSFLPSYKKISAGKKNIVLRLTPDLKKLEGIHKSNYFLIYIAMSYIIYTYLCVGKIFIFVVHLKCKFLILIKWISYIYSNLTNLIALE